VSALRAATTEEISVVPGIGEKMAKSIADQIRLGSTSVNVDMKTGEILDA